MSGRHFTSSCRDSASGLAPPNLIALVIHNKNHADRSERGRNDQDQDPALQRLNHSRARGSGLGVAERATLGKGRHRREQDDQSHQGNAKIQIDLETLMCFFRSLRIACLQDSSTRLLRPWYTVIKPEAVRPSILHAEQHSRR